MSTLRNKVQLIGHPGADPESKTMENGNKLVKFSMATNDSYKNAKGEKINETQWHNIVVWGKTAELAEKFVKKGKEIGIEGKLNSRSYEDAEGHKKYITEVVAHELLLLGGKE